jgi:ParB family chromosome partitioning protein
VSERRRGLGRGLGALIPTGETGDRRPTVSDRPTVTPSGPDEATHGPAGLSAHYAELPLDSVTPNPRQPRQVFDEDAMAELVHSLHEVGLLQPIVVRSLGSGRFELVAGERRWRAARLAGFDVIPAIVRDTADDALLRDALLENLHRAQLNPLEEAAAYDQLLQDFGCTQEQLATRIGRSRPQVSNTLRLLRLPPAVQRRVAAGVLSAGHARALLGLPDPAAQERLATRIVAEGLSVRMVEEMVALGGEDEPGKTPRKRHKPPTSPALAALAATLSDHLETRVLVELGRTRGTLAIQFATVDDLERIVDVIAPTAAAELRTSRETGRGPTEQP